MPYREWTPLWKAPGRLASELRISRTIAEEIVRLVLVDGEVSTRGCYRYDRLPRLIPKDCWVQSPVQHNFMLPDWLDIEIDWAGLLACAPNHLPRGLLDLHKGSQNMSRDAAIKTLLERGRQPGQDPAWPWKRFGAAVRNLSDGWSDGSAGTPRRRFSDKSIERATRRLMKTQNKRPKLS